MKHSIVTWDSSFRNFFHLLHSLSQQRYDLDQVEVVVVEQRSQQTADELAEIEGIEPVREIVRRLNDSLKIEILYMGEPLEVPYHPGRVINAGLKRASGEIISTMDIDILVPSNFLSVLDAVHAVGDRVAVMHRYEAAFPCGTTIGDWKRQIIDYDLVLNICPNRHTAIPGVIHNKAPLLSTRRAHWKAIEYYDEHRVFSTAYTLFGRDVSLRMKLLLGDVETPLPVPCVHPWHPTDLNRSSDHIQVLYQAQSILMKWSEEQSQPSLQDRTPLAEKLYAENKETIDKAIQIAETEMQKHIWKDRFVTI